MHQPNEKWDRFYLGMAEYMSTASKDPSTHVGSVLVNYHFQKEFLGYNGLPRGVQDLPEYLNNREFKYPMTVHAEVNAIRKAGDYAIGSTMYTIPSFDEPPICTPCCGLFINAQGKDIVGWTPHNNEELLKRWGKSIALAKKMCLDAGVTWRLYQKEGRQIILEV